VSRGLGARQRHILAGLAALNGGCATVEHMLTGYVAAGCTIAQYASADAATRRALAGLRARGLVDFGTGQAVTFADESYRRPRSRYWFITAAGRACAANGCRVRLPKPEPYRPPRLPCGCELSMSLRLRGMVRAPDGRLMCAEHAAEVAARD
jgi:hypothetical protein